MSQWHVSIKDDSMDWEGDAASVLDAAERAVEHWHEDGEWAGDPMPGRLEVQVRNANDPGSVWRVTVTVDWSPSFSASLAREERAG